MSVDQNFGNFKALLNFRISAGDSLLDLHVKECSKRSTYTSKKNTKLVACMHWRKYIVAEVLAHSETTQPFFGLQADEVTDISNWEKLGIIVRYVNDRKPEERLLAFVDCESVTGEKICERVVDTLKQVNLQPQLCPAQTYDGASNMAARVSGLLHIF